MRKLALVLVLVAPLALAACGGASSDIQLVAYVKHAASKTAALKSEHMVITGSINGGGESASIDMSGDFINSPLGGNMSFELAAPGHTVTFDEVIDGTMVYAKSPMLTSRLPNGKTWAKLDFKTLGVGLHGGLMTQSPAAALQRLEAAGSVTQVGSETIDGVQTTHYRVTDIDLSKLAGGAKLGDTSGAQLGPADVWVGNANGYVYRETISITITDDGQTGTMTLRADFSKFGEAVHVNVPPAKDTVDMTKSLRGLGA